MDKLHDYIVNKIVFSTNEDIYRILNESKPVKRKTINFVMLVVFIAAIAFYATFNLLLMSFTILIFVYWVVQIEFLSVKRQYKNVETRKYNYFNDAQKLFHKGKYDKVLELYQTYTMKQESSDNIYLYVLVLFVMKRYEDVVREFDRYDISNDVLLLLYKFSLFKLNKFDRVLELSTEKDLDYVFHCLIHNDSINEDLISERSLKNIVKYLN